MLKTILIYIQEGKISIWNIIDNKHYVTFNNNHAVQALCFNPQRYWLSAAVKSTVIIWVRNVLFLVKTEHNYQKHFFIQDLVQKSKIYDLGFKFENVWPDFDIESPTCLSLAWSIDGQTLYAGYTDHVIRVWKVYKKNESLL